MQSRYRFAQFELLTTPRQLLVDGQDAALGARGFDLLVALIERRDRTVGKDELVDVVWPGLVVEGNNLQVQISTLRKVLGPRAISTIPGRGYRFALEVSDPGSGHTGPDDAANRASHRQVEIDARVADAVAVRICPRVIAPKIPVSLLAKRI